MGLKIRSGVPNLFGHVRTFGILTQVVGATTKWLPQEVEPAIKWLFQDAELTTKCQRVVLFLKKHVVLKYFWHVHSLVMQ